MLFTYRNIWKLFLIYIILDGCRNKSSMTEVGKTKPKKCKQKSVRSYFKCANAIHYILASADVIALFPSPPFEPPCQKKPILCNRENGVVSENEYKQQ